ncbi:MAG: hypothetical protein ACOX05_04335 [Bacillota bacterium]|jgi:hypothetical protein
MKKRIVEAYVGEYASGKSELAVNRAIALANSGHKVTVVDLDLVEPCYTLRSLQDELRARGVKVLAWQTSETRGLGESGQTILPAARWSLRLDSDLIFDIGYGVGGSRVLNLIEGADRDPDLEILLVANFSRPLIYSVDLLVEYAQGLGRLDGLIANTHLDRETTPEIVWNGLKKRNRLPRF